MPVKKTSSFYENESDSDYQKGISLYEDDPLVRTSIGGGRMKGNRGSLVNKRFGRLLAILGLVICVAILYLFVPKGSTKAGKSRNRELYLHLAKNGSGVTQFPLVVVADLDKRSRVETDTKGKWRSILKKGVLTKTGNSSFAIQWNEDRDLFTAFAEAGRGMELSAILDFQGRLYTFDDRTGLVFEIDRKSYKSIPRYILMEGDGNHDKGQKTEWATVKDGKMYVGSFGKEYTNPDGSIKNHNNMWVSVIDSDGVITHEDWTSIYNKMRDAVGVPFPGYMIHEAIVWSPVRKQWVILPRRVSAEAYDEEADEKRGSNVVILASENFETMEVRKITPLTPTRGFSAFKFLPFSNDFIIVALKSEENEEAQTQNTYITVFSLDGTILMPETEIPGKCKYEGIEFLMG